MIRFLRRSPDSTSPKMMALSLFLHGIAILALIIFAYSAPRFQKPGQESVSRVRIVESVSPPRKVEKLRATTSNQKEIPAAVENTRVAFEETRQEVAMRTLTESPVNSIHLTKRKKPPRRVDPPKPPEKKPEQAIQKKEDTQSFLNERLASIRREVESKKKDVADLRDNVSQNETASSGPILSEAELLRWLQLVKNRINSNWSIFVDNRSGSKITVIGVRLGDDGRVMDVAIDESSGDDTFDRSAMRAVLQAWPFPPLTAETREKVLKAGGLALRFTPRGLQ
jgi:colicin import membrane protein